MIKFINDNPQKDFFICHFDDSNSSFNSDYYANF